MKYLLIGLLTANVLLAGLNGLLDRAAVGSNLSPQTATQKQTPHPPVRMKQVGSRSAQTRQPSQWNASEPLHIPDARVAGLDTRSDGEVTAQCQLVGPYAGLQAVEQVQQSLSQQGIETLLREESRWRVDSYLVYVSSAELKEQGSALTAVQLMQELKSRNIDAASIPRGAMQGEVSVGVFRRKNLALAQLKRVTTLGFPGALKSMQREQKVYHLLVQNAQRPLPGDLQIRNCAEIAQERQFL